LLAKQTGGTPVTPDQVEKLMTDQLGVKEYEGRVVIVRYKK
jgi:hypothetical protein